MVCEIRKTCDGSPVFHPALFAVVLLAASIPFVVEGGSRGGLVSLKDRNSVLPAWGEDTVVIFV